MAEHTPVKHEMTDKEKVQALFKKQVDAMEGRLESDIGLYDPYWSVRASVQHDLTKMGVLR